MSVGEAVKFRLLALAAVVTVTAVAGWLVVHDRPEQRPPGAGQVSGRAHQLEVILAGAVPTADGDQFNLDLAARKEALIAQCMSQLGMAYTPKDPHILVDTTTRSDFTSPTYARQYGFGISSWPSFADQPEPDSAAVISDIDSRKARLTKQADCSDKSDAVAETEFGVAAGHARYTRIDDLVRSQATYRRAEQAWASCAASHGVQAPSRLALIMSLRGQYTAVLSALKGGKATGAGSISELAAAAGSNSTYQQFRTNEIDVAVRTFPCSQVFDAAYTDLFIHTDQATS